MLDSATGWLANVSDEYNVQLWDLSSDNTAPVTAIEGLGQELTSIWMSSDGRWLATVCGDDKEGRLWDLHSEYPLKSSTVLGKPIGRVAFNGDSRWVAAAIWGDEGKVFVWNLKADLLLAEPRVLQMTPPVDQSIWIIAISPDGRWLFTGRHSRTAQLWDLSVDDPTPVFLQGHHGIQSVVMSSDSHWMATASRVNAQLWDLKAADPASSVRVLRGHEEGVWDAKISADSGWLITDSSDSTVRRWSLDFDRLLKHSHRAAGRTLTPEERNQYLLDEL